MLLTKFRFWFGFAISNPPIHNNMNSQLAKKQIPKSDESAHIFVFFWIGFRFLGLEWNNNLVGQENPSCSGRVNTSHEQETSTYSCTVIYLAPLFLVQQDLYTVVLCMADHAATPAQRTRHKYHTPLLHRFFHGRCLHSSWNCVGAYKSWGTKHLVKRFPKTYRSVLAPSWLSSNRAWKSAPGGCDIHRRGR